MAPYKEMGRRSEAGMAYVAILILLAILSALGFAFLFKVGTLTSATETRGASMQAHYLAESAANHAMWRLLNETTVTVERRVSYDDDDAQEQDDGGMEFGPGGLQLGDRRYVGIRFLNVNIPQGATIVHASVEFTAKDNYNENTDVTIFGEDTDDAPGFTSTNNDLSIRPPTAASVTWHAILPWQKNMHYRSPGLAPIIKEIVNRPGWTSGNAMVILFRSDDLTGIRKAESHDDDPANAPSLHVMYSGGPAMVENVYYMHSLAGGRYGYKARWHTETTFATIATVGAVGDNVVHQSYVLYVLSGCTPGNFRDEFSIAAYNNNDGSLAWAGDWIEFDDGGVGPSTGKAVITGGELRLNGPVTTVVAWPSGDPVYFPSLIREVDLSEYPYATLSFNFRTGGGVEAGEDSAVVEVSGDGGGSWVVLEDFIDAGPNAAGTRKHDISPYITADTQVRFRINLLYGGPDEYFYVDNVEIKAICERTCYLLFVVPDASTLNSQDNARKGLMESWGYDVILISDHASQAEFDTAAATAEVAYISKEIDGTTLGTKLRGAPIGVVIEEMMDDFGIATDWESKSWDEIKVIDNSHYITSPFSVGTLTYLSSLQPVTKINSGRAPGFNTLAEVFNVGSLWKPALGVIDVGGELAGGGTAAERRVQLPWGDSGFDINALNADGRTIMKRAIEWAAHWEGGCVSGSLGNQPPTVDAGSDQTLIFPTVETSLDGEVTDDGLPDPPATVTTTWSQRSGPGTAQFDDASLVDTGVRFSDPGTYVLRLTADDGELNAFDEVTITVFVPKYFEKRETWSATVAASWRVVDLSGSPYNVPANAVLEVAIVNHNTLNELQGGVRAVGSSLNLRRFDLHEAEGGGVDAVVMHVQADSNSRIEYAAENTTSIQFILLGYWTTGTYVETFDTFKAGADSSWQDHNLAAYGVGPGQVAEIVSANTGILTERHAGVRTDGSGLGNRTLNIHEAEAGGVDTVTMFVNAGSDANATVELWADRDAAIDFYLVGYWSTPPGTYIESFAILGSPGADLTWEDKDLSGFGVPANAVVQITMANGYALSENRQGLRENGSTLNRSIDLHEAEAGGEDLATIHVNADHNSTIEWGHEDVSDSHQFYLMGWWE